MYRGSEHADPCAYNIVLRLKQLFKVVLMIYCTFDEPQRLLYLEFFK